MPQMNGFKLLREIRKIDENVKVCFLTAVSELTESILKSNQKI
jgi:DNA-binding response OmpR family regulator